jgi:hypothetical protein
MLRSVDRSVRRGRRGFVLNVDGGSWQELDYNEVRTTEQRDKHTRGECMSSTEEDRKAGTLQSMPTQDGWKCRDSTKYAPERMYRDVAEALQSIQQGPSDTRSQSYRLLAKLSSLIY